MTINEMTTVQPDLAQLQERVQKLEWQLGDLWTRLRQQGILTETPVVKETESKQERILAILRARGFISDPTPYELALAQEWEKVPEEEKRRLKEKLDSLQLDPPLSQWIHDNRR